MDLKVLEIPTQKVNQLKKANIFNVEDLVKYLPRKYYDFRNPTMIKDLNDGDICSVVGTIIDIKESKKLIYAKIQDDSGWYAYVYWFNQKYVKNFLKIGQKYIFCGKIKIDEKYHSRQIFPIYFNKNIYKYQKIIPVYKKVKGMANEYLENLILTSLDLVNKEDYLDNSIRKQFHLIKEWDAFNYLHKPKNFEQIEKAKERFIFDDLFLFNFQLQKVQRENKEKTQYPINSCKTWKTLNDSLSFEMTNDQKKCLRQMYYIIKNGYRLNTLVQGDVGSGKTIIAIFMMLLCAEHGYQSCIMAPTEILAKQHFIEIKEKLKPFDYEVVFLSGSLKTKEKEEALKKIKSGEAKFIVGTHAVIQKDVDFKDLGLVVVDEQHRFGVVQRNSLSEKSIKKPHYIIMSATPIPRTLSMALYGNTITVMTIKTKPKGRKPVKTIQINDDKEINKFMLKEIRKGRQCYIVCPLIEKSDSERMANVDSVNITYNKLVKYFKKYPEVKIGLISGKMKQKDINEVIQSFNNNDINILVSTTIVEVGVNIPNATVMVIKNSERFGLSQLHQLRGRVGRSIHQSYCILQPLGDDVKAKIMCSTNDGFEISKQDLKLRGPGDFLGIKQSGDNKYIMLTLAYPELYNKVNLLVKNIYDNPSLYNKYKFINDYELI